jgi:hypothetical protein
MKSTEIIVENNTTPHSDGVKRSLPKILVFPNLTNQDAYLQYRFGLAMASAGAVAKGEIKYQKASEFFLDNIENEDLSVNDLAKGYPSIKDSSKFWLKKLSAITPDVISSDIFISSTGFFISNSLIIFSHRLRITGILFCRDRK